MDGKGRTAARPGFALQSLARRNRAAAVLQSEVMKHHVFLFGLALTALGCASTGGQTQPPLQTGTRTGDFEVFEKIEVPQLDRTTSLIVYLPPDYRTNTAKNYPVLYMTDGETLFSDTAQTREWGVDEKLQRLFEKNSAAGLIVVGIYSSPFRDSEYFPWDYQLSAEDSLHAGEGAAYARFIVETVKPFIDRSYRTRPEASQTAIAGAEAGSVLALYAGFTYPRIFGLIGSFSHLNVNYPQFTDTEAIRSIITFSPEQKIAMLAGGREWDAPVEAERAIIQEFTAVFAELGLSRQNIHVLFDPEGERNPTSWGRNFIPIICTLYGWKE